MKKLIFVSLFVLILQSGAFAQAQEFDLGISFAKVGDYQVALQHFQKSFDKNLSPQKIAQIHYNLGVCFYQLKQTNSAITAFQQAVQINPNYERAFYALGMAFSDLKNLSEAEIAFRSSLKLSNNGETWFDLAFIYIEQKKYNQAFESFQKAINFGSIAIAASHNNLGVIYAMRGNLKMANKEIETAKNLGFSEAENNLEILHQFMISKDKTRTYAVERFLIQIKNEFAKS